MKQYQEIARQQHWFFEKHPANLSIEKKWWPWLFDKGSLTAMLIDYSNDNFYVKVLREYWGMPYLHEQKALGSTKQQLSLIREVELYCNDRAVVFARSIIPRNATIGKGRILTRLGSKPLGHLLFKKARVRKRKREVARISYKNKKLWARRTPYVFLGEEILISEFFLTELG